MGSTTTRGRRLAQWAGLAALSAVVAFSLDHVRLPAAFLIGPLVAAIVVRLAGAAIRVARPAMFGSQAVVGAMIGAAMTPSIVTTFRADWPILLSVVAATIVFANLAGWMLSRFGVVPGTTGVWGSSPGAANAMVILSEAHGGDIRLVAFMQYLRVLFVASTASIVARVWLGVDGSAAAHVLFPPVDLGRLALTIVAIAVGGFVGLRSRLPNGAMMGPLLAMAVLGGTGVFSPVLPPWLLIAAYAGLGWNIGLRFTREAVAHAARALPWIVVSILALMSFSAGLAVILVYEVGVDPLTAFLATSPGGLDTIAVIAASTPVDVSFVLALQVVRFFVLVFAGPALSRFVARHLPKR
jgi:membrane AbrB-like protein